LEFVKLTSFARKRSTWEISASNDTVTSKLIPGTFFITGALPPFSTHFSRTGRHSEAVREVYSAYYSEMGGVGAAPGRGVYFRDPDGHVLELMTVPQ
jgi:hypothetical protein